MCVKILCFLQNITKTPLSKRDIIALHTVIYQTNSLCLCKLHSQTVNYILVFVEFDSISSKCELLLSNTEIDSKSAHSFCSSANRYITYFLNSILHIINWRVWPGRFQDNVLVYNVAEMDVK